MRGYGVLHSMLSNLMSLLIKISSLHNLIFFFCHSAPNITGGLGGNAVLLTRAWLPQSQQGPLRLDSTHFMRFPCCSSMDSFEYIGIFFFLGGWGGGEGLSGNQALVHHLEDSNTKVKRELVCLFFFICGKLQ